jgi:hypothetical protein
MSADKDIEKQAKPDLYHQKRRPVMISGSSSVIKKSELAFANPDSIN